VKAIKYKKWVLNYFISAIIFPLTFTIAMLAYDPLMLFHKPINRDVTLVGNMRVQAAGIIHSLNYDSYILGTSMLENTSANSANSIIGGNFANISLNGSDYFERSYVLDYALKNRAKSIIYSLDSAYIGQAKGHRHFPIDSFSYLYSDNPSRAKFYLQSKYIKCLLKWSESRTCVGAKRSVDRPNSWIGSKGHYSRFGGLDKWFDAKNNNQIKAVFASISATAKKVDKGEYNLVKEAELNSKVKNAVRYIDDYLISFVRSNPETKFNLIFPPYSRIRYAQWHQLLGTTAKVHEAVVEYLAQRASELGNLTVYGYENQDFLDDISNYKDASHYNEWVNKKMLIDIANNENTLTSDNVDGYLNVARKKALDFDLIGLGNEIDAYLDESAGK